MCLSATAYDSRCSLVLLNIGSDEKGHITPYFCLFGSACMASFRRPATENHTWGAALSSENHACSITPSSLVLSTSIPISLSFLSDPVFKNTLKSMGQRPHAGALVDNMGGGKEQTVEKLRPSRKRYQRGMEDDLEEWPG